MTFAVQTVSLSGAEACSNPALAVLTTLRFPLCPTSFFRAMFRPASAIGSATLSCRRWKYLRVEQYKFRMRRVSAMRLILITWRAWWYAGRYLSRQLLTPNEITFPALLFCSYSVTNAETGNLS